MNVLLDETNKYILKPLVPQLIGQNMNREKAKCKIELVPFDHDSFDFISFVDFAYATHNKFAVYSIKHHLNKHFTSIELMRTKRDPFITSNDYDFLVHIGDFFACVNIYVKNHMSYFTYQIKENVNCIILPLEKDYNPYLTDINNNDYDSKSLLYQKSLFFNQNKKICPQCILVFLQKVLKRSEKIEKKKYLVFWTANIIVIRNDIGRHKFKRSLSF